jgi:hypothetical protein
MKLPSNENDKKNKLVVKTEDGMIPFDEWLSNIPGTTSPDKVIPMTEEDMITPEAWKEAKPSAIFQPENDIRQSIKKGFIEIGHKYGSWKQSDPKNTNLSANVMIPPIDADRKCYNFDPLLNAPTEDELKDLYFDRRRLSSLMVFDDSIPSFWIEQDPFVLLSSRLGSLFQNNEDQVEHIDLAMKIDQAASLSLQLAIKGSPRRLQAYFELWDSLTMCVIHLFGIYIMKGFKSEKIHDIVRMRQFFDQKLNFKLRAKRGEIPGFENFNNPEFDLLPIKC